MRSVQNGITLGGIAGALFGLLLAEPAAAQEAYFRNTRTDANVYVAPVASSIEKVAILPFKAPTELIGSSVSDIIVREGMPSSFV